MGPQVVVRSALMMLICLIAVACSATGPKPRPLASGFATETGVADPYEDGKRHLTAGRYDLAVQRFGQELASDRKSLDALNGLAIAHARLGRFVIAQTYFERALRVHPTSAATLNNYGWFLIEQGRFRDAEPFLELALRHADEADVTMVAANIEGLGRAKPSALVAALAGDSRPAAKTRHRLIREAANVYRLETLAETQGQHEPAATSNEEPDGIGWPALARPSTVPLRAVEPHPFMLLDFQLGGTLPGMGTVHLPEWKPAPFPGGDKT